MTLAGKVALVTVSSQGIVLRFAQAGADVVINYRSHPEGAEETLEKVKAIGGKWHLAQCPQSQAYMIQQESSLIKGGRR
jgi:glucose 1-dehydrogenase